MDLRKQLSVKTGSVRRLGGDYRSYAAEYVSYRSGLEAAMQSGDAHAIRRAREFVDECHATRVDIGLRLREASTALEAFMAASTELVGSDEWAKAQQTLQDNRPQQDELGGAVIQQPAQPHSHPLDPPLGDTSSSSSATRAGEVSATPVAPFRTVPSPPPPRFSVAVYGGSQAKPGDASYERAKQLGRQLAQQHFHIVAAAANHTAAVGAGGHERQSAR